MLPEDLTQVGEDLPSEPAEVKTGRGRPKDIHTKWGDGQRKVGLQSLSPKHKQAISLMGQGVPRDTIAEICDFTPEYISMLASDPLCKEYLAGLSAFVDAQIESMYGRVATTISDAMDHGNLDERLKGARLHLEVTKRIGRNDRSPELDPSVDRLSQLAERLTSLLGQARQGVTIDSTCTPEQDNDAALDLTPTNPSSSFEE